MENLIIYLAVIVIVGLIIALAKSYKTSNTHKENFEQKVKELNAKDNTINTQKSELANRKDQIDAQKKLLTKSTEDLELVKAGLESCREDFDKAKSNHKELIESYQNNSKKQTIEITNLKIEIDTLKKGLFNYQNELAEVETKYSNCIEKITTLEEENQELLTQLNTKKNGKRNPKN